MTRGERLQQLTRTTPDSDMGKLLRTFWHPVAVARKQPVGRAQPLRVLGEDLTLYRGEDGTPHLVGSRCPHRGTVLYAGGVEGDEIRCMYHGWKFDGTGRCTQRPAERDTAPPPVKIAGYPVREYGGLIFAYLGPDEPPAFDLPRRDVIEQPNRIVYARSETWKINWFQTVENAMDGVHLTFVHRWARVGRVGEALADLPELEYLETEAGMRQIATRGAGNVRISDWSFPNNNHISSPGLTKGDPWIDFVTWKVPVDDETTTRFNIWSTPSTTPEADRRVLGYFESVGDYNPADHHDELLFELTYPDDPIVALSSAQDYVAQIGQGTVADRGAETLGRSDAGIALMRRIFFREMDALREGRPTKAWRRLATDVELPKQLV
jgi:5,5'-dehydrodivanillate O-demethylase